MDEHLIELLSGVRLFAGEDIEKILDHVGKLEMVFYAPGESIISYGEYDDNCFILLEGTARVHVPGEMREDGKGKFLSRGEFFGEIAALSGLPRSADIVAEEHTRVMEIPKEIMFSLMDDFPSVRTRLDAVYKDRALNNQLRKVSILAGLPGYILDGLIKAATIETYDKGDVVFNQDEEADAFYLVLFGFVKVSQESGRKTNVLAYLKGEQYFGEFALLEETGKRSATVTAISRTQVIKISRESFTHLLKDFPSVDNSVRDALKRRKEMGDKISSDSHLADTLEATIESGIIQTRSAHLLDTTKCIQCDTCVTSCASLHDGHARLARKGVRLNGFLMAATSCRHCDDPACMYKCPTGAICRDSSGEIYHKSFCVGCGLCAKNCPYDNIMMVDAETQKKRGFLSVLTGWAQVGESPENIDENETEKQKKRRLKKSGRKVVKCDMCRDYEIFGCVYNCPTGAIMLVNPAEYFSELIPVE